MAGTLTVLLAGEVKKKKELRYSRESIQDTGLGLEQISLAMKTFLNGGGCRSSPSSTTGVGLPWGSECSHPSICDIKIM